MQPKRRHFIGVSVNSGLSPHLCNTPSQMGVQIVTFCVSQILEGILAFPFLLVLYFWSLSMLVTGTFDFD